MSKRLNRRQFGIIWALGLTAVFMSYFTYPAPLANAMDLEIGFTGYPRPTGDFFCIHVQVCEDHLLEIYSPDGYTFGDDVYWALVCSQDQATITGGTVTAAAPSDSSRYGGRVCDEGFAPLCPDEGPYGQIVSYSGTPVAPDIYLNYFVLHKESVGDIVLNLWTSTDLTVWNLEDVLIIPESGGRIWHVDHRAPMGGHGQGWCAPFQFLQDALAVAEAGHTIKVAQSTYRPDQGAGVTSGDRTATFGLINGVTIEGGYAGYGEPDPNARDIDTYTTILSGDIGTAVVNTDNSYHVVTSRETEPNAVLDGFTITGGNANGAVANENFGGGIYNYGSPTVNDCTFSANSANNNGGGMFNILGSPKVTNCTFNGNSAGDSGGGMDNYTYSSPILTNCTFIENLAHSGGGGLCNYNYSSPTLTNCSFIGNSADSGGGMFNRYFSDPTVTNCIFSGNSADSNGGAIYIWDNCILTLINCSFSQNSALNGAALACDDPPNFNTPSTLGVTNCILWDGGGEIWNNDGSAITINYSDVEGGWTGPGSNNINTDPLFADSDGHDNIPGTIDDNLHLFDGSPCIDAGNNTAVPLDTPDLDNDEDTAERIPLDIDGEPRFSDDPATPNTGVSDPPDYTDIVDMGADEHSPCGSPGRPYPPVDLNHDCKIDFLDIAIIGDYWLTRY